MRERMGSSLRAALMTLIAGLLLPAGAQAREPLEPARPSPAVAAVEAGFDVVVLRPLGLVATAVGAALFVPAALLTAPNGLDGIRGALKRFVTEPAESVFERPIGDF